jgi:hypothetical protein
MENNNLNNVIKTPGLSSVVNESTAYENFNLKSLDFLIIEEFLRIMPLTKEFYPKRTSLASIYKRLSEMILANGIEDREVILILNRMYLFMLRYTSFNNLISVMTKIYNMRLAEALKRKLIKEFTFEKINTENMFKKGLEFPSQKQTLLLINKTSIEIKELMKEYILDIIIHLTSLNILSLKSLREKCFTVLYANVPINDETWTDITYIYCILSQYLTNIPNISAHFESIQFNQLCTYIEDLFLQLYLIVIPYLCIFNCITERPAYFLDKRELEEISVKNSLKDYDIRKCLNTSFIQLDHRLFFEDIKATKVTKVSKTQFKNILTVLEKLIKDLSVKGLKLYYQQVVQFVDFEIELREISSSTATTDASTVINETDEKTPDKDLGSTKFIVDIIENKIPEFENQAREIKNPHLPQLVPLEISMVQPLTSISSFSKQITKVTPKRSEVSTVIPASGKEPKIESPELDIEIKNIKAKHKGKERRQLILEAISRYNITNKKDTEY